MTMTITGQLLDDSTDPSVLRRQIPDINNERPTGHYIEQMTQQCLLVAVPECISKLRVILQRHTWT